MGHGLRSGRRYQLAASAVLFASLGVAASSHASAVPPPLSSYIANPPFARIASVTPEPAGVPARCHTAGGTVLDLYCYSPEEMRAVYGIPAGAGADGSGQTVVVVSAYGSATIQSDLAAFDLGFHLPDPALTILGPNGSGNQNDQVVQGWVFETSMDVEWAHAIAPGANIVLAVARSDNSHQINETLAEVVGRYPGAIITQSFGADETFAKRGFIDDRNAHRLYAAAAAVGDTVLAASGDFGASGAGDTSIVASYPASDPLVTAVGGTEGWPGTNDLWHADPVSGAGGYGGEQVWNETFPFPGASGGAPSQIFPSPSYQSGLGYGKRTVPDVSYNASVAAGVLGIVQGSQTTFGGTSAATPQWAGIFAIANEQRAAAGRGPLGPANPVLYAHPGDFHDITVGDNIYDPTLGGFSAGPGYDLATGLGTPNVPSLLPDLVAAAGVSTGPGQAPDATCLNQQLSGVYHDVNVQPGASCTLSGATVTGSVQAEGRAGGKPAAHGAAAAASLTITNSTIQGDVQADNANIDLVGATVGGNVQADKATGFAITGSTVSGSVHVTKTSGAGSVTSPGLNVVCDSAVLGDLSIENSSAAAPWSIGGGGCQSDATGGAGSVVAGDLRFDGNAAASNDVSNNMVGRNLECNRNGGVTGSANLVAGTSTGQCSSSPLPG